MTGRKGLFCEWIKVEDQRPKTCVDILFTDGKEIYKGWLETYELEEDPLFYSNKSGFSEHWPENITHWMKLPKLPSKE